MSRSQRPLPDKTVHLQETDIHAPGRIRTRTLSMRAASDPRLRPRGHWVKAHVDLLTAINRTQGHYLSKMPPKFRRKIKEFAHENL